MDPAVSFDCQSCGACCYGPGEYVEVNDAECARLDPRTRSRYVTTKAGKHHLRMWQGHCLALHARQGHFSCRIYALRPGPCHVVETGSRECLAARRRMGIPD